MNQANIISEEKMLEEWQKSIPTYLCLKNSSSGYGSYKSKTGKRVHLLMVEGTTDHKFYKELFKSPGTNMQLRKECDYVTPGDYLIFKRNYYSELSQNYNNVAFVQAFIKVFNSGRDNDYTNIDFYGFIDQDNHYDISNVKRISQTTAHDLETNLMRCYFDKLFDQLTQKENAFKVLRDTLTLTTKQGILAKICWAYEQEEGCKPKNWSDCYNFFKTASNWCNDFNFEEHLSERIFKDDQDFKNFYDTEIGAKPALRLDFENLEEYLRCWLLTENKVDRKAKAVIDRCFEYSNGHRLGEGLTCSASDCFGQNEQELRNKLIGFAVADTAPIFQKSPLNPYVTWRRQNEYIY